ncbi:MAG: sulfatase-like hydrolase/transferase [Geminicoccaceae bacterium]
MNGSRLLGAAIPIALAAMLAGPMPAAAQDAERPNILLIVSDDTGWGDLGPYLGGEGRGMPTPNFDRLADEGMVFTNFYGQPSCTPGRAAIQTGRIPNRSGMTTVAFQGQGGGLPAAEWTLGSVLKEAGYKTYFTGKWHLGEADYALPNAQGYDVMKYAFLYHLNAYTYPDPKWHLAMSPELRQMFEKITTGALSGNEGQGGVEGQWRGRRIHRQGWFWHSSPRRLSGRGRASSSSMTPRRTLTRPSSTSTSKNHQPNIPHPDFEQKSISEVQVRGPVVEPTRGSATLKKLDELGLADNTVVSSTVDAPGRRILPDAGQHALPAAPRALYAKGGTACCRWSAG